MAYVLRQQHEYIALRKFGAIQYYCYIIISHEVRVILSPMQDPVFQAFIVLCITAGKKFNYSTFGWTLISAVIEKASGESFLDYMQNHVFGPLGMTATKGEFHKPLVYHRAR